MKTAKTIRRTTILRVCQRAASVTSLTLLIMIAGCATTSSSPYASPSDITRNPIEAQRLTLKGAELIGQDDAEAERLLRAALAADLYHGPAHNNLGVVHLRNGRLYEAANEFEWARKLMPGHPDPRMNLALTLERAGRINEALTTYETALEVYPNHLPTLQAIARLQVRYNRQDDRTPAYLDEIALRSDDASWRDWAREQQIRSGQLD